LQGQPIITALKKMPVLTIDASPPLAPLNLRGVVFDPPLFTAPMAGITHSAFRRLLAGFGGYGALYSEMLSAKYLLHEDLENSPWLKRRPGDGQLVYQLLMSDEDRLPEVTERLQRLAPDAVDLNLACDALPVRRRGGGSSLFENMAGMRAILRGLRARFAIPLLVKVRLGDESDGWPGRLHERFRLFEDEGVDAVVVHTRFRREKLGRPARPWLYPALAEQTCLPIIANGDIHGPDFVVRHAGALSAVRGLMVGRMLVACPWLLGRWRDPALAVDYVAVWDRFCAYLLEDFSLDGALKRLKIFTPYFARNFFFGHNLFLAVQNAPDFAAARARAQAFFEASPRLTAVDLAGL
jgi:tRNA-dihydrouridine synthase B